MTVKKCRYVLAAVWLVGVGFLVALIMAREVNARDSAYAMLKWLLPNVTPFISLAVTAVMVVAPGAAKKKADAQVVDLFVFLIATGLSIFYLAALLFTLFTAGVSETVSEAVEGTSMWLVPFQALLTASLGVFFVKPQRH